MGRERQGEVDPRLAATPSYIGISRENRVAIFRGAKMYVKPVDILNDTHASAQHLFQDALMTSI